MEFDFKLSRGSLSVSFCTVAGEPESGFTFPFSEYPFERDKWYHASCEVSRGKILVKTSFNDQEFSFQIGGEIKQVGFMLAPNSEAQIKNIRINTQ